MALRCLMIPIIVGLFLLHLPGGTVRFAAAEPAVGPLSEERVEQAIRDLGFEPGRAGRLCMKKRFADFRREQADAQYLRPVD